MAPRIRHRHAAVLFVGLFLPALGCTPEAVYNRSLEEITLVTYNRMYPAFAETTTVAPGEVFPLGEGEYEARVIQFLPDFQISDAGRVISRSDQPKNPAVRLEVLRGRSRQAFAWAFMTTGQPHFRAADEFAFTATALRLRNGLEVNKEVLSKP